jgi:hypothetical protein
MSSEAINLNRLARPKKLQDQIVPGLDHRVHNIGTIIYPYMLDNKDPKYRPRKIDNRGRSIEYLTIITKLLILRDVIKRKDGKVATQKNKQLSHRQYGAISLLTIAAVTGISNLLGGGLREAIMAAILCALLFAYAIDK